MDTTTGTSTSTDDINTDMRQYSMEDLYDILDLNGEDVIPEDVERVTNQYIDRYTQENNEKMVGFFQDIQDTLLDDLERQSVKNNRQTDEWFKYQALPQSSDVQRDKNTNRVQKIDVFNNQQVPMNRKHLGINNNFNVDVAQDTLNPNLTNSTTRFINLDSQFRQASGGIDTSATDYTLDLSDPLNNVLNMRLYSFQIPYTWYVIDNQFGNTCFWITNKSTAFQVSVTPGNYLPADFVVELNDAIVNRAGFSGFTDSPVSYNVANAKITIQLNGGKDPDGNDLNTVSNQFNAITDTYFTFFDFSGKKNCMDGPSCTGNKDMTFNHTLGWIMGFRLPILPALTVGNTGISVLDLNGPKYFILVIDDYNQNHINNGVVTITELSTSLSVPSYYNPTQPHDCTIDTNANVLSDAQVMGEFALTNILSGGVFSTPNAIGKTDVAYGKTATVLPTAPRTLTQSQLYTINEIVKNREKNTSYRGKAPNNSDTFAIIPIKMSANAQTGGMYVEFSGSLQDNKRIYFGPVNIDRMRVKLVDDRGYTVNLHGGDWCVTIIADILYQY
jgi:hypothetical protein